jgi:hypothetical protein
METNTLSYLFSTQLSSIQRFLPHLECQTKAPPALGRVAYKELVRPVYSNNIGSLT